MGDGLRGANGLRLNLIPLPLKARVTGAGAEFPAQLKTDDRDVPTIMKRPRSVQPITNNLALIMGLMAISTGVARAQTISWQAPQVISGTTDVLTNGTYFGSWAPFDGGANSLPVNGVTFHGFSDLPGLTSSWAGGSGGYGGFGSPGTGDANYNTLLQTAQYGNGNNATFSWGGMTPGHTYEIQIWVNDARGVTGARWENLSGGDVGATAYGTDTSGPVGYSSPLFSGNASAGYYIVGAFVADNTGSEEVRLTAWGGASASAQINLVQVRDITSPVVTGPGGYSGAVLADAPLAYYRFSEPGPLLPDTATNSGSLGAVDNAANFPGAKHQVPGAIIGDPDTAMSFSAIDTNSDDGCVPTIIPYEPALNQSSSFTIEAWLRPTEEGAGNAQCPLFNCQASTEDYGWDFYQRASVAGSGQQGFEFYMNDASGARVGDAVGGSYTVGQWCHLVAVYDSVAATATLYIDGVQVAQSGVGAYVPNPSFPMSIGGYSDGSQNPFVGDIDEFAFYGSALTAAQVLAHYQNGTNSARSVSYNSLVTSDGALEYLRLNEPAVNVTANAGALGAAANGVDSNTGTPVAGPDAPLFPGFEATNGAIFFNGANDYVELLNPPGLNFTGPITLEAWVQPSASQNGNGDIIAHGYNDTANAEVALRVNGTSSYQISAYDGNTDHGVTAPIPAADLDGNWIHLVGTYDGASWNLYRNGVLAASASDSTGSLIVSNANWAVGARGRWKNGAGYPLNGLQRQFTGAIDEVAIYNHALTLNRVQTHFAESLQPLTLSNVSGHPTLTWVLGTLVQSANVAGPYTPVGGASSPYTIPGGSGRMFYRIQY